MQSSLIDVYRRFSRITIGLFLPKIYVSFMNNVICWSIEFVATCSPGLQRRSFIVLPNNILQRLNHFRQYAKVISLIPIMYPFEFRIISRSALYLIFFDLPNPCIACGVQI